MAGEAPKIVCLRVSGTKAMGVDIHAVVEIGVLDFKIPRGLCYFEWERDTQLFFMLGSASSTTAAVVPARGMPDTISVMTQYEYGWFVVEDEELSEARAESGAPPTIGATEALQLVEAGASHFLPEPDDNWISGPGYFGVNWITPQELRITSEAYKRSNLGLDATLAVLDHLVQNGINSRLVYWFDA